MKTRVIETNDQLVTACVDLAKLTGRIPFVITVTEGRKIRTDGQNKRHWVSIESFMAQISEAVGVMAEDTGYTPLEAKRLISQGMSPEHVGILYARTSEVVHEILKAICNIPTSTRLGTKDFSKFDDVLEQTIAQIIGEVRYAAEQRDG